MFHNKLSEKILIVSIFLCWFSVGYAQETIYVSTKGNDSGNGTLNQPFLTIAKGLEKALTFTDQDVSVNIRGGVYYIDKPLEINSGNYQLRSITLQAYARESVTIAGSKKIKPLWQPYKNNVLRAKINLDEAPDQLYINGHNLPMARYPNFDTTARVYNGTAEDAINDERVKRWSNPAGGYIHALHDGEWGDFHYLISGKDANGKLLYDGGWQNNRPAPMNKKYRYVENIFEELDAPGEWFYNKRSKTLFLYPPAGADLQKSTFTVSTLTGLIHIRGSVNKPLKNVIVKNISFTQTARTFMQVKEPLLRSDWRIYRGGVILLDRTENVRISGCNFFEIGGNAVFLSNYNKRDTIKSNHIFKAGGNALAFVGNPGAVRSPSFSYESFVPWDQMDYSPGPKTPDYPQYCVAEDNLIHQIGTIEKQATGVEISMSSHITISHNTIYKVPRAGINVSEGTWGGHIIEFNDVFETVMETGDHGAFNSWGRDRYWRPERNIIDSIVAAKPGIEFLDVIDPVIIRNNRFECEHGWDIDLDDGSSNYRIYNNLCLNGGLKLREGYNRVVTNNILVNSTFHLHVWLKNSEDVFEHNLITLAYSPIMMTNWGKKIDSNLFLSKDGLEKAHALLLDKNSLYGDAGFVNPQAGDYEVNKGSPALTMGFRNFDMDFGVTSVALKKIAARPVFNPLITNAALTKGDEVEWLGANFKNIESLGERSAAGLHDDNGALLSKLPAASAAAKGGLKKGDVIIKMGDEAINSTTDLLKVYQNIKWTGKSGLTVIRNQNAIELNVSFK